MKDKISKFFSVIKRDGLAATVSKTGKYVMANYASKVNVRRRLAFSRRREELSTELDRILSGGYDRLIVWRSSFGWNVPLFQRPQQIARCLADKRCLVLYEVTRVTDRIEFIKQERENLYLLDYEIKKFENMVEEKLRAVDRPKYLQVYSTCWDVRKEEIDRYVADGFRLLYEYIDDLNPVLAGTADLPQNVRDIHAYVTGSTEPLVVVSADRLYEDIVAKRGGAKNIAFATNGVDLPHFTREKAQVPLMDEISASYGHIVGYYGALASWFDYDTVKRLADRFPDRAFVLIGIKYDASFDESGIEAKPNVKYLGPVDYRELPDYAAYFDVAWIPFVMNEITAATNPIKVFEYMALGKYIVTSDMPECRKYRSVNIARGYDEYVRLLEASTGAMTDEYRALLRKEARENSWDGKADTIIELMKSVE